MVTLLQDNILTDKQLNEIGALLTQPKLGAPLEKIRRNMVPTLPLLINHFEFRKHLKYK